MSPEAVPQPIGWKPGKLVFRVVPVVMVVAAIVLGVVFRERILGTPLERSLTAYTRGDFERARSLSVNWLAGHPNDPEAIRVQARSLLRLGRSSEAFPLLANLGGDQLHPEDLVLVGNELLKSKQDVLAITAFNAATKLAKEDSHSDRSVSSVKPLAPGSDAPSTIRKAERLSVSPSGAGLSELVLAIAVADDPARGEAKVPTLQTRVLRLDRSLLREIDGLPAVRKLMARFMLQDGKTAEAKAWLAKVPVGDDPEANWLMSRALLVEGKLEGALAAAAKSGDYEKQDLTRLEPAPYVGAKRCSVCHASIFTAQQKTGHAETFWSSEAMSKIPLPSKPVPDPGNPDVLHKFERDVRSVKYESDEKGKIARAVLDYALGSGRHGMTTLAREESGMHRMHRLSYYSIEGEQWDLTNGFEKIPKEPENYVGQPLSEETFTRCLNCHTTRFTSEKERNGPEAADHGIGCERCHGPADHHLRAVELDFPDMAIARPKSATPAQRFKVCSQCHGSDGVIPPSDPRFLRFQAANLPFSRCVTESGGKLDCVACHDPHRPVVTDHHYYEVRCLACHTGKDSPPKKLPPEVRVEPVASQLCPVNSKTGCIDCHMPKPRQQRPLPDFTDHHIRVLRGNIETKSLSLDVSRSK